MPAKRAGIHDVAGSLTTDDAWNDNETIHCDARTTELTYDLRFAVIRSLFQDATDKIALMLVGPHIRTSSCPLVRQQLCFLLLSYTL